MGQSSNGISASLTAEKCGDGGIVTLGAVVVEWGGGREDDWVANEIDKGIQVMARQYST